MTGIGARRVTPLPEDVARLEALGEPLPEASSAPEDVLARLGDIGSSATVATAGGRYFGFVIGGSLPAALAANWVAAARDQNAEMYVMSPATPIPSALPSSLGNPRSPEVPQKALFLCYYYADIY